MSAQRRTYKATEREVTHPRGRLDDFFSGCGIAISSQHDFDPQETFSNEDFDLSSAAIKVCVTDKAIESLVFEPDDALISLTQTNRASRKSICYLSLPLSEINNTELRLSDYTTTAGQLEGNRYSLILHRRHSNIAEKYRTYSRKSFRGRGTSLNKEFPRAWLSPDEFRAMGLDGGTLWHINWKAVDLDQPMHNLVLLCLNKKHELSLLKMLNSPDHTMLRSLFTAEVMAAVLTPILRKGFSEGLENLEAVDQAISIFKNQLGVPSSELQEKSSDIGFDSYIASWCKVLAGVADDLGDFS